MRRQSLLLSAPAQLEWISEEMPPLQSDEVLIQTTSGAISIGTELPLYLGTARSSEPARYPRMTGYESVGISIDRGSAVQNLNIGDRVVAFYGHRTHGIVSKAKAIVVPDGISDALALLTILSCDVTKGIRKVGPQSNEPVLITGAGTIGLLTVFMLKALGVQIVDVVEPHTERCVLALEFGARTALPPQEMIGRSDTYPVAFECSSHNTAFELIQRKLQHDARICMLADGNIEPLVLTPAFHEKELLIVGSSDGWDYQKHAKWFFQHVQERVSNLEQLFGYITKADNLISTFEQLATGTIRPLKVLVHYSKDGG